MGRGFCVSDASVHGSRCRRFTASRKIRAGVVTVNCRDEGDIAVPFGGDKASGFGRAEYRSSLRH
ncbi:aldehyde dehydrogenase family protein [Cupriavidus sp. YR651]|uniref:aldehyde dehydrogenase family protein n=1 Tax=Cupriavidus sp. YR651 TaxID=1855315 RepID=UPI002101AF4F|nr:aldehyde dehydrogenase family protein [Cupriavidus sp. YR651]